MITTMKKPKAAKSEDQVERLERALSRKPALRTETTQAENIAVDLVDPSPFQPRRDFSPAGIEEMAASLRALGQIEPIVVRRKGERYELLVGERRLRGAKRAGLALLRAEVREASDMEARSIIYAENHQRQDLNAIEEALAFRQMLQAGDYPTQQALADALGVSQGHVANRLRLLEMPPNWQQRIISREIPPTHARALLAYAGQPGALAALEKPVAQMIKDDQVGTDDAFEREIYYALRGVSESIKGASFDQESHREVPIFTPTDEQRARLNIIKVGKEERALNQKLWQQLQKAHAKEWVKKHPERNGRAAKPKQQEKAPEQMTPAEKREATAEKARHEKELEEQFRKRLYAWKIDWLRYLIAGRLVPGTGLMRVMMYMATARSGFHTLGDFERRGEDLDGVLRARGAKMICHGKPPWCTRDVWSGLAGLADDQVAAAAAEWARKMFWADEKPCEAIAPADVAAIAEHLGVDLAEAWRKEQAGPLSTAYWELHTKEQLAELGKLFDVYVDPGKPKGVAVKLFLSKKPLPLPGEIKSARAVRG